ncbi:MAG: 2Fe-2S iron-sulfur cluster binding domain-containing protein [Pseudomonadota bacterium]
MSEKDLETTAAEPKAVTEPEVVPEKITFIVDSQRKRANYFAGETILDTARRAGIAIATSCENGDCGTCMIELVEGEVHMRQNQALSEEDQRSGCILACQSVPTSKKCTVEIY